jgi:hypothetical protein
LPTQEERLQTVEYGLKQFKAETTKAYQEMAVEVTMVKGLTEDVIIRLATIRVQIDQRFGQVDARLERVDGRFGQVDARLGQVDGRLDRMEMMLTEILARLPKP